MNSSRIERLYSLLESFQEKEDYHEKKRWKARKPKSIIRHYQKKKVYMEAWLRAFNLSKIPVSPSVRRYLEETKWKVRLIKKEEGRDKFESLHRYSMWFYSSSFGADYGTYTCDRCQKDFHHSPSTISKGTVKVFNCACGHCTNLIIKSDWSSEPYQ